MGIFSSIFGGRPKTSKEQIAGLTASTIDFVINYNGIENFINGCLVLDKDFRVSFREKRPAESANILAVVMLCDLKETEFFKKTGGVEQLGNIAMHMWVDNVVETCMRIFSDQSPEFSALPLIQK